MTEIEDKKDKEDRLKKIEQKAIERIKSGKKECFAKTYLRNFYKLKLDASSKPTSKS